MALKDLDLSSYCADSKVANHNELENIFDTIARENEAAECTSEFMSKFLKQAYLYDVNTIDGVIADYEIALEEATRLPDGRFPDYQVTLFGITTTNDEVYEFYLNQRDPAPHPIDVIASYALRNGISERDIAEEFVEIASENAKEIINELYPIQASKQMQLQPKKAQN